MFLEVLILIISGLLPPKFRGTIMYKDGKIADLIYLNTVIIDGLPEDIYSYLRANPKFTEQTTADQFFDEKQSEAYRELGFQL